MQVLPLQAVELFISRSDPKGVLPWRTQREAWGPLSAALTLAKVYSSQDVLGGPWRPGPEFLVPRLMQCALQPAFVRRASLALSVGKSKVSVYRKVGLAQRTA